VRADAVSLPFDDARFDLVVAFDVIEHVPDDDGLLDEIARVLRVGGRLVASVPLHPEHWTRFDGIVGHCRRYRPSVLVDALARRALRIDASAGFGMKPRSAWWTEFGLNVLERHTTFALRWYEAALPWLARAQRRLRWEPGAIDAETLADMVVVCTRHEGAGARLL
jgi:SAM-dependent methyltransferase